MVFSNLYFSLSIQRSCMVATNCSSCWCIVSVFAKNPVCNVYKLSIQKVRNIYGKRLIAKYCFTIQEI